MLVDVGQRPLALPEISVTSLRPDLVLWSTIQHKMCFVELTVPWEDATQQDFERNKLKFSELATEAEQRGWSAKIYPVEVGCQGFVATSAVKLIRDLGISGQALSQATKKLARMAEWSSQWIWVK